MKTHPFFDCCGGLSTGSTSHTPSATQDNTSNNGWSKAPTKEVTQVGSVTTLKNKQQNPAGRYGKPRVNF